MKKRTMLDNVIFRNMAGIMALVLVHYLADQANLVNRTGFSKTAPYFFLLLLYGWIVFHNRVLFEKFYLHGRKRVYFGWTFLAMGLSSLNMHYILTSLFNVRDTLPHIVSFWVYTVAGLGVYVIWRYLGQPVSTPEKKGGEAAASIKKTGEVFSCLVDGFPKEIQHNDIHYVESLENYIRIITSKKPLVVRLSLKETELRLPAPPFIRISRSCMVNSNHIHGVDGDIIKIHGKELKVGKVFKRYVEKFLK